MPIIYSKGPLSFIPTYNLEEKTPAETRSLTVKNKRLLESLECIV